MKEAHGTRVDLIQGSQCQGVSLDSWNYVLKSGRRRKPHEVDFDGEEVTQPVPQLGPLIAGGASIGLFNQAETLLACCEL